MHIPPLPRSSRTLLRLALLSFVLLQLLLIYLNVQLAQALEADAAVINLAGRQRMLTQQIGKTMVLLTQPSLPTEVQVSADQELREAAQLFERTLQALMRGGQTRTGQQGLIQLEPIDDVVTQQLLLRATGLWLQHKQELESLQASSPNAVVLLLPPFLASNRELLSLMNALTTQIEVMSRERAQKIRWQLLGMFLLEIINGVLIVYLLYRRYQHNKQHKEMLQQVLDEIAVGVCLLNTEKVIVTANQALLRLLQRPSEQILGAPLTQLFNTTIQPWIYTLVGTPTTLRLEPSWRTLSIQHRSYELLTLRDVTVEYALQEQMTQLAYLDPLTQIPNRRLWEHQNRQVLARATRNQQRCLVAVIDIDCFKMINDQHGHLTGDHVLKEIAQRLSEHCRADDMVARIGGDEFAALFTLVTEGDYLFAKQQIVQKLEAVFHAPIHYDGNWLRISASLGFAMFPEEGQNAVSLLQVADQQMYQNKALRRTLGLQLAANGAGPSLMDQ
ncbi:sensor domain-containing diguanylate cyclase [Parvibium lacunae]|uniref:Diguanylate cyclase n=1 Tax=Parvibium lacunae TaxID=1888893 RepID=A0A368L0R4_9BURK|nr:diguanylate cyclase [Parvibium lacunae]RCS57148.1 diguanylate cyclase [Parvibium lacunae]